MFNDLIVTGVPYDKYEGMRDWMDKSAVTVADEKFIIGLLKQQPELLDKLGML